MPDLNTKQFTLDTAIADAKAQVTELEDGDVLIEGWASDVRPDRYNDVVEPSAFKDSLKSFLELNPVLLYNHDIGKPLGKVLELEPREQGLWMKALIAAPTAGSWAEDVVAKVKRGLIRGLSVRGHMSRPFGRDAKTGHARVTKVDLSEISVTPLPVNPGTLFAVTQKAFADETAEEETTETDEGEEPYVPTTEELEAVRDYFDQQFADATAALDSIEASLADGEEDAKAYDPDGYADAKAFADELFEGVSPMEFLVEFDEDVPDGVRQAVDVQKACSLDRSPGVNWVEKVGGLPNYICRIATHLVRKGKSVSHAVAIAVNTAKKWCATGEVHQWRGIQRINAGSRAEACAAVASWNAKKARARAS